MDYEKAYKEAIERAKGFYIAPNQDPAIITRLEHLFPELKESDDERIRNYLTEIIKARTDESLKFVNFDKKTILAWLEKQKPVRWSEEDEMHFKSILNHLSYARDKEVEAHYNDHNTGEKLLENNINWLNSFKQRITKD